MPDSVEIRDILRTLPPECFQQRPWRALGMILLTLLTTASGLFAISQAPWYLLPLAWFFTGTALTGLFVVGHDCGHRSFSRQRWINDLIGTLALTPLLYPFHAWRLSHDHHHRHTNKLGVDNAWSPLDEASYVASSRLQQLIYRAIRGPLWWMGSLFHLGLTHFDPDRYAERERPRVRWSIACCGLFGLVVLPLLAFWLGPWNLVSFWLLPWLVFHFWMSTFTLVHHTHPAVSFVTPSDWNQVEAQLRGTVHCRYPRWIEWLCHDINIHVPHHLSVAIPAYNLRRAQLTLDQCWGEGIQRERFGWPLMRRIINHCQLHDPSVG